MKAYEFPTQIDADGKIALPEGVLSHLAERSVRVILLVNESPEHSEQIEWSHLTAEQFLAGYNPSDAIYDEG